MEQNNLSLEIPLSDMITALRQELVNAQMHAKGQRILFEMEKVELELKVAVSRSGKGNGGIKFWVFNAGTEYKKVSEISHTVKLTFNTKDSQSGEKILVSKESTEKPRED